MTAAVAHRPFTDGLDEVARWLGVTDGDTLRNTFPQVYDPAARGQRFAIYRDEQMVAHAAAVAVTLACDSLSERAWFIGSVATNPRHRGQGLATRILTQIIDAARATGVHSLVLWSDQPRLYARLGFEPAGEEFVAQIHARSHPSLAAHVRPATPADLEGILALHEAKPVRVMRDIDSLATLLSARGMRVTVWEEGGSVRAYACFEKGADFPGWWHECGGADDDVMRLIEATMHGCGIRQASLLLSGERHALGQALSARRQPAALGRFGTGAEALRTRLFVDGLDSV